MGRIDGFMIFQGQSWVMNEISLGRFWQWHGDSNHFTYFQNESVEISEQYFEKWFPSVGGKFNLRAYKNIFFSQVFFLLFANFSNNVLKNFLKDYLLLANY